MGIVWMWIQVATRRLHRRWFIDESPDWDSLGRFKRFAPTLRRVSYLLSILAIASAISITWKTSERLQFDPSSEGWSFLLTLYHPTILIAGGALSILIAHLTVERLRQTERQLVIIAQNNQFTNFYVHRNEFSKALLANPLFRFLHKRDENLQGVFIQRLYPLLYYGHPSAFQPHLNVTFSKHMDQFNGLLQRSGLLTEPFTLRSVPLQEILKVHYGFNRKYSEILVSEHAVELNFSFEKIDQSTLPLAERGELKEKLRVLNDLFWHASLIDFALQQDGAGGIDIAQFRSSYRRWMRTPVE